MLGTYTTGRGEERAMRLWRQRKRSEPDAATSLKRIRNHLAALGYDTRDLTDEELVARIERFSHVSAQAGITMQQTAEGLHLMSTALARAEDEVEEAGHGDDLSWRRGRS